MELHAHIKEFICDQESPITLFHRFCDNEKYAFLLESADTVKGFGRYSFIGFDPLLIHEFTPGSPSDPFAVIQKSLATIKFHKHPSLTFFQAGFVGYFSYEVVRHYEKITMPKGEYEIPEGAFFLPKKLLVFDHFQQKLTLIAYSQNDLQSLIDQYKNPIQTAKLPTFQKAAQPKFANSDLQFQKKVKTAKEKIAAGEIFQIVLSQKFSTKTPLTSLDIYRRLRANSPAPYMYLLKYPNFAIVGGSPETLVKVQNNTATIHPIAGTRRKTGNPKEDRQLAKDLLKDQKELAEHLMLVDLGRNDLGRLATPATVKVTKLLKIQNLSHVIHLVSEIKAKMPPDTLLTEIFKSVFPAGTLSGAPKVRAMELIAQIENRPREIYGGAVGYFGLDRTMDFAIAIRTILHKNHHASVTAGAGIVYDSLPENEDQECHNKARGPLLSLQP